MPGRGTRRHAIRIPDDLWQAALEQARRRGDDLATVIRAALQRYVDESDDERPTPPS